MDNHQRIAEACHREHGDLFLNFNCNLRMEDGSQLRVDALAVDFESKMVWLCGVGNPQAPSELSDRLRQWQRNWAGMQVAMRRQFKIPGMFEACPHILMPVSHRPGIEARFAFTGLDGEMPSPKVSLLVDEENVAGSLSEAA